MECRAGLHGGQSRRRQSTGQNGQQVVPHQDAYVGVLQWRWLDLRRQSSERSRQPLHLRLEASLEVDHRRCLSIWALISESRLWSAVALKPFADARAGDAKQATVNLIDWAVL
jgi:hypothetical protein